MTTDELQPYRLFVHGPSYPGPLHFLKRKAAAGLFHTLLETTRVETVVVLNTPGLDRFALHYFTYRNIPVVVVPAFRSRMDPIKEVAIELDIDLAVCAVWAKEWRSRLEFLEIPCLTLWEKNAEP
jgi:hypothetical protein